MNRRKKKPELCLIFNKELSTSKKLFIIYYLYVICNNYNLLLLNMLDSAPIMLFN